MSVGVPAGIITALLVLLAAFLAALYGKGNGVSAISAFCICNPCLHCTCTCASLMPFHRQAATELQSRKMTSLPMATCPSEATGRKNVQTREEPPKVGDLPVQLSGFYVLHFYPLLYCGALTERCKTKLLRVFSMVPFQSQDSCGGRMYPAEHTEQLWPAPNTHCNKSRPPFQQKTLSKLIVLLILTGLSMRQNPR